MGKSTFENKPYSRKPSIAITDTNHQGVNDLTRIDRRIKMGEQATELEWGQTASEKMVEDFESTKVYKSRQKSTKVSTLSWHPI